MLTESRASATSNTSNKNSKALSKKGNTPSLLPQTHQVLPASLNARPCVDHDPLQATPATSVMPALLLISANSLTNSRAQNRKDRAI